MTNFLKLTKPLGQTFIPFYVNPLHILAIEDISTPNRKGCKIHTTDGQHTFVEESADCILALLSNQGSQTHPGAPAAPLP